MASATASHVFAHAAGQSARRTQRAPSARPLAPVRPSPFGQLRTGRAELAVARVFGGEDNREKKALTRETEPEEYWTSERERKGESPFKDPLALIGILSILFPFIFLGIAIATGLIDTSGGR